MALGDIFQLDNPFCQIQYGTTPTKTDISSAVQRARIMVDHVEIDVDAAFGEDVRRTVASAAYSWSVELELRTDGYGGTTLDQLFTAQMHPPLGTGDGSITIVLQPDKGNVAAGNPAYKGKVAVSGWEPLGPGNAGSVVVQTRTMKGFGALSKLTSGTP